MPTEMVITVLSGLNFTTTIESLKKIQWITRHWEFPSTARKNMLFSEEDGIGGSLIRNSKDFGLHEVNNGERDNGPPFW